MDVIRDTNTLLGRCWFPLPLMNHDEDFNSARFRAAEMASFNGHGAAGDIARLFATSGGGGALDGTPLLSQASSSPITCPTIMGSSR
jgi:hypothetical protein